MSDKWAELPEGWVWVSLGDVCTINPRHERGAVGDDTPVSFVPMVAVDQQIGAISGASARPYGEIRKGFTHFAEGDVVFARITPCMENGKVAVARGLINRLGCGTTEFHVLRPLGGILPEYVHRYLRQESFRRAAAANMSGTAGQLRVPTDYMKSVELPLPPLAEQRRIVEKIEALFDQSRTARRALDRIPPLLKKFRQAVLAAAFRGDLTRDWREQYPDVEPASVLLEHIRAERPRKREEDIRSKGKSRQRKQGKEITQPKTAFRATLPQKWVRTNLGQVLEVIQYGTSVKASASAVDGIPILRMGNIRDGRLDFSDLKYLDPQQENIAKYTLEDSDILINRTNSPELVGKAALFDSEGTYLFASYLIRLRPHPKAALPAFINFAINSKIGREHVQAVKHQVAGQANINTSDIRSMLIPLPPIEEQEHIVAKIEALFATADAIEARVEAARRRAEKLEQSILARAFRGELVTQDPDDEPASILHGRIGIEREMAGASKRLRSTILRKRKHHAAERMANS